MNLRLVSQCAGLLLGLSACKHPLPCEEHNRVTYHPIELRLIVTEIGTMGTPCDLEGMDAVTLKKAEFHSVGAFYITLKDAIAVGDTVVKNKGASAFLVKKRGYDIRVNAPCNEIGPTDAYGYAPITTDTIPKSAFEGLARQSVLVCLDGRGLNALHSVERALFLVDDF